MTFINDLVCPNIPNIQTFPGQGTILEVSGVCQEARQSVCRTWLCSIIPASALEGVGRCTESEGQNITYTNSALILSLTIRCASMGF